MPEKQGSTTILSQENLICIGALIVAVILAAVLYPGLGSLSIWSCLIALGVGAVAWGILHFVKSDYRITSTEATIASIFLMLVVVPVTDHVGTKLAFDNKVSYQEFWGGYEVAALTGVTTCEKDGNCENTYACDWYWVKVVDQAAYTEPGYTDSNKVYHPSVYHAEVSHMEHRHHDCPYTKQEYTFSVNTTLGGYTIGSHWLPANPEANRWHGDDGGDYVSRVPGDIPRGIPAFWAAAKSRIDAGDPGPVTAEHSYENYILASQDAALKRYSPYIDQYTKDGVLPVLNHTVKDFYYMSRAYFVGNTGVDQAAWTAAVERYNGALGASLQGDLYFVIADANKVTNPDTYIQTLTAYWQSPKFEKYAISKNAIVVVLGTEDGKTVKSARASTGMPTGNSTMIFAVQNELPGKQLTPDAILGKPKGLISPSGDKFKVTILHTQQQGGLESIMWGANGFERVCMSCKDANDHGVGFDYLKTQIQPTGGQLFGIYAVVFFFALLVWGAMVFLAVPSLREWLGHEPFGSNPQSLISRIRNRRN